MIKDLIKYLLLITVIFCVISAIMCIMQDCYKIDWLTLIGSILSSAYILSLFNPLNYLAFVLGGISSVVLTIALWGASPNGALTYALVFLPAQIYSFFYWKNLALEAKKSGNLSLSAPRWQTGRERILTIIILLILMIFDALISNYLDPTRTTLQLACDSLLLASAIIANVTLIFKLTDSRIYWIIFSLAGLAVSSCTGIVSLYLILMFLLFFVINIIVLIQWIKKTR